MSFMFRMIAQLRAGNSHSASSASAYRYRVSAQLAPGRQRNVGEGEGL